MAGRSSQIFKRIVQLWLDAESVRRTKAGLQDALNKGTDVKGLKKNFRAADAAMAALRRTALGLGATLLAAFSARKLLDYADTWKLIQGRLKLVTEDTKNLGAVTNELLGIAARTRTSFESVATLYQRVALNADQLGRTQSELLDITETVSKSIQIGGASASEAAAGVTQLAQALASGRLQGDEFRSIMENMPDLARRLAKEWGVTVGELRAMSKAGELTADVITDAILRMKSSVDEDFKDVPVTIGGAFAVLGNSIMEFVGQADEGTGASGIFTRGLLALAGGADLATEAIEKLNEAREKGGMQSGFFQPGGQGEGGAFFGEQGRRRSAPGGDFGQDIESLRLRAAADRARAASPEALATALIARLESERTAQIVKTKAAAAATADEIAELNDLYRRGNEMLRAGNLSLEQRFQLTQALAALGFEETKAKTAEQLLKLEDEHIQMLIDAHELGIATQAEDAELLRIHNATNRALQSGNLELEERLRLTDRLKDTTEALGLAITERQAPRPDIPDLLAGRRNADGSLRIAAPMLAEDTAELAETYTNQWLDANASVLEAAESTAFGVMGAWSDALGMLRQEGEGLSGFLEALFRGIGGAALGGLAQLASAKVAENIARAIEETALAVGRAAVFDFAGAAAHTAAATTHKAAAVKWGLLGGVAAAGQAALAGGGRGGQSGGIPSGARDPAGRLADKVQQQTRTIYVYVDGIKPNSGEHQQLVGDTIVKYQERRGNRITGQNVAGSRS